MAIAGPTEKSQTSVALDTALARLNQFCTGPLSSIDAVANTLKDFEGITNQNHLRDEEGETFFDESLSSFSGGTDAIIAAGKLGINEVLTFCNAHSIKQDRSNLFDTDHANTGVTEHAQAMRVGSLVSIQRQFQNGLVENDQKVTTLGTVRSEKEQMLTALHDYVNFIRGFASEVVEKIVADINAAAGDPRAQKEGVRQAFQDFRTILAESKAGPDSFNAQKLGDWIAQMRVALTSN